MEEKHEIQQILEKCKQLMENEIDKLVVRQKSNKEKSLKFSEGKIITEYTKTLQGLSKNKIIDTPEENLAEHATSDQLVEIAKELLKGK